MTTILYSHPYAGSFNHAILETVKKSLEDKGKSYEVLDLYADGFNPAFEAADLRLYSHGETTDPLVERYLKTLTESDEIVMIFPIWWGMMPAIVKGFFDKVMLQGTAFVYDESGALVPAKINMRRTVMITTSQAPTELFAPFFSEYLPTRVFDSIGFHNAEWHNCPQTSHGPAENRERFLKEVAELF